MSYVVDKATFIRRYQGGTPQATDLELEDAWRLHFMGQRVSLHGDLPTIAELAYLKHEGKRAFKPNQRRAIAGGHPYEFVLDVTVYARDGVFVGALFENRAGKRHIELTSSVTDRLFRLSETSETLTEALKAAGARPTPPIGYAELDAAVKRFSDDPKGFRALVEKDPKAEWLEVMPRAAVLARWGPKGDRAARRL